MKRLFILLALLLLILPQPIAAMEFTAPSAPDSAQSLMPSQPETFGEGLWQLIKASLPLLHPALAEAMGVCLSLTATVLLLSLLQNLPGGSTKLVEITGAVAAGILLLRPSSALIQLGIQTVEELSQYGKLLLPVMTAAMAAQGGTTASAALYAGTVVFDTILSELISRLIVPMTYLYLCLAVANSALGENILERFRDFIKWLMTWCLKIVLYVFTGYMGITGAVSGSADAAAVKAAKLTISGMVPVVGGILSDASETVLVGAGVMKNAAGIYGLLAILAILVGPFIRIGVQYLLLKMTAAVCGVFGVKSTVSLISDFSAAMGMLLAMTGTVSFLLLISTVCFMKGVG